MTYLTYNQFEREYKKKNQLSLRGKTFTTYGKAFQIHRKLILTILVIICIITPFTNWIIPFLGKIIKTGITYRWN